MRLEEKAVDLFRKGQGKCESCVRNPSAVAVRERQRKEEEQRKEKEEKIRQRREYLEKKYSTPPSRDEMARRIRYGELGR